MRLGAMPQNTATETFPLESTLGSASSAPKASKASFSSDPFWSPNRVEPPIEIRSVSPIPSGAYMPPRSMPPRSRAHGGDIGTELFDPSLGSSGISRNKKTSFQKLSLSGGWIGGQGASSLAITEVDTMMTFVLPLFGEGNYLAVSPQYSAAYFEGPSVVDLPSKGISGGVDFTWLGSFNETWGGIFGVTPSYNSDTETSNNAIRYIGRGLLSWNYQPEYMKILMGVILVDRRDLTILPAGGLIWTPNEQMKVDLLFPTPKIAYRSSMTPGIHEDWVYMAGVFGGRTFAVERMAGGSDQLTYADIRLLFGYERIKPGGAGWFFETGLVFDRQLEYWDNTADFKMKEAVVFRGGLSF